MITRVTQRMLTTRSLTSLGTASTRMADAQEQMTTGRKLNRPSDGPADTAVALKARAGVIAQQQYQTNASDGLGWLSAVDTALQQASSLLTRANTLAIQGANTASNSSDSEDALVAEVSEIKQSLLGVANTQYLGRPVFGGTTAGSTAFALSDPNDPTSTVVYTGDTGTVSRRVGTDTVVRVDASGTGAFGGDSNDPSVPNVFTDLDNLVTALKSGDASGIQAGLTAMQTALTRISGAAADEGARMNQINAAVNVSQDTTLALQKTKSDVEDVDVAEATINMQTQANAYKAALMAVGKTSQQSLLDFLS